jgi:hypothetical protein
MRLIYFANVGTRDVTCDGNISSLKLPDGRHVANCRADGARWLKDFDELEDRFAAPILLPGLKHVLDPYSAGPPEVRVILFYTDQDETVRDDFRRADTVNFARVLERWLPRQLPVRVALARVDGNPADYNNTLQFFRTKLGEIEQPAADDVVYIAPVGGPDAANVGLFINAVRRFRDRCVVIYVMPGPQVQSLDLPNELLGDYTRSEAQAHLRRRDYAALEQTLRHGGLGKPWHRCLCAYADCRTRFDFQGAAAALETGCRDPSSAEVRGRLQSFREELNVFLVETPPPRSTSSPDEWEPWFELQRRLLTELFFNLRRKALQGDWVDFLSRLFRWQEAVLRLTFETAIRHSTSKDDGPSRFTDFERAFKKDEALAKWLASENVHLSEPNNWNLFMVLRYWVERGGQSSEYGPLYNAMRDVRELSALRHESIAAHGYRGVNRQDVENTAEISVDDLLDQVKSVIKLLKGKLEVDPYDDVDGLLRNAM